jgi:chromosome segregation ATPase
VSPEVQEQRAEHALNTQQEVLKCVQSAKSTLADEQGQRRLEILEAELRAKNENLSTSERLLKSVTSELAEVNSSLHSKDVEVEQLKDEKSRFEIENDRLSRLNVRISDEIQSSGAKVKTVESQLLKLQSEFELEATKAANLKQLLSVSVGKERNARQLVSEVSQIIEDQKNQIRLWKKKSAQHKEHEQKLQHAIHNMKGTHIKDLSILEGTLLRNEQDRESLSRKITSLKESLASTSQTLEVVQLKLSDLERKHNSVEGTLSDRNSVIVIKDKIIEDKCQEVKDVKDRHTRERSLLATKLSDYEQEVKLLQKHNDDFDHERVYELEEKNRDLDLTLVALQDELGPLRKCLEDKDQELQALRFVEVELQRMRQTFQESEEKSKSDFEDKLQQIRDELVKQQENHRRQVLDLKSSLKTCYEEKSQHETGLRDCENTLHDCKKALQQAQQQAEEAQNKMEHYKVISQKAAAKVVSTEKDMRQLLMHLDKEKTKTADSLKKMLQEVQQS